MKVININKNNKKMSKAVDELFENMAQEIVTKARRVWILTLRKNSIEENTLEKKHYYKVSKLQNQRNFVGVVNTYAQTLI